MPYHTDPIDAPNKSAGEGCDLGFDPTSRAMVRRLTSGPMANHLIYCEQPYASPDGKHIALIRGRDFTFENDFSLLIANVDTLGLTRVERSIPRNLVHNSWSEWIYYATHEGGVRRVSLLTLNKETVLPDGSILPTTDLQSISPDNRLLYASEPVPATAPPIVTYDTQSGRRRVIFSHPDNHNSHLQTEPTRGALLLMQLLSGSGVGVDGKRGKVTGVAVVTMNADGSDVRTLPIGGKHTAESSGHMSWITGTERVACCLHWERDARKHDARHPQGNLAIAGPDDKTPVVFPAPGHAFYHVSVSRCGRYFVCDDFMDFRIDTFRDGHIGPARIVVGCFASGKCGVLVNDCLAYGLAGSSNWEPVPYFTADNRYVIYNSSPHGTNQVFQAAVPDGFLQNLAAI